jgi:hypothetical protein
MKKLICLIIAVIMLTALAACGAKEAAVPAAEALPAEAPPAESPPAETPPEALPAEPAQEPAADAAIGGSETFECRIY